MNYKTILPAAICCLLYACSGNQKPVDLTADAKSKSAAQHELATVAEKALSSSARLPGAVKAF